MSDPVSNMDVEDVLSSIRRLVSEEAKPVETSVDDASVQNKGAAQEQLRSPHHVSLRPPVQSETRPLRRPNVEADRQDQPVRQIDREPQFGVPPSNDHTLAESASSAHEESEPLEDQKLVLTAALRVQEEDSLEAALADPYVPEDSDEMATFRPVQVPETDEAPGREPLRKPTERPKPFQFSSNDTLFERATKAMDALKDNEDEDVTSVAPVRSPAPESPAHNFEKPTIVAKIVPEKETEVSATDEDGSPELVEALKEMIEPEAEQNPEPVAVDVPEIEEDASTLNFVEEEEPVLDEDTLRDMISDMVREELQGELGDRITRNVRKLVRREIQRVMASKEFE